MRRNQENQSFTCASMAPRAATLMVLSLVAIRIEMTGVPVDSDA